ncbi:unnamed protein product [Heligmosomoides polygyrus]|uniref:Neur_chan_memb domain-containing protein n=1 Tax=Heligmosomoides polygyrus TaxID=6339 RepID=A0A183FRW8_HELPZ|nr:unnamed protein product [Heligmosomoides polygyrus]
MLNWMPWLLMMHRPGYRATRQRMRKEGSEDDDSEKQNICIESLLSNIMTPAPPKLTIVDEVEHQPAEERRHLWRKGSRLLPERAVVRSNAVITSEIREKERNKDVEDDWKFAAMVVDRLCLYIFSFFILFSTLTLFLSVPSHEASED